MDFLFSNIPPLRTQYAVFADKFHSLIPQASRMDIAVGYITADSLAELKQITAYNDNIQTLNLIIGMHRWDKFTRLEYKAAVDLNSFLRDAGRGEVRLVTPFRFHGKLYSYSNTNGAFAGIIGSNNLGSIVEGTFRTYEASLMLQDNTSAVQLLDFIEQLSEKATENLNDVPISENDLKQNNPLLEGHEHVDPVNPDEFADCISSRTNVSFQIPVKGARDVHIEGKRDWNKSNLNVYFGEGRLRRDNGLILPRHWYEVELIVPKTVTDLPGYPNADEPFDVITDDRWKFRCKVSGTNRKNFRSEGDLKILGKWIKGRLENAGILNAGQLVTKSMLAQYGRNYFTLTKTSKPNLWYLNFGENQE